MTSEELALHSDSDGHISLFSKMQNQPLKKFLCSLGMTKTYEPNYLHTPHYLCHCNGG